MNQPQQDNVIYPDEFADDPDIQVLGRVPAPPPAMPASGDPLMNGLFKFVEGTANLIYNNRTTIRNVAYLVGGTYVLVKGPPIVAKSFADTMHYLREGWHGRGYENNNKEK